MQSLHVQSLPQIKNIFACSSIQTVGMDNRFLYFKHPFFYQMCIIPFEFLKIIDLSTFGSNMFLTLKIMDFENVALIKIVHIYVMEAMNTKYI